jgi:hypothetical protein
LAAPQLRYPFTQRRDGNFTPDDDEDALYIGDEPELIRI